MRIIKLILLALCIPMWVLAEGNTPPVVKNRTTLFHTLDADSAPYRIPTITCTRKGRLVALSDKRWCGADIGFGHIDIVARVSDDNGKSWSAPCVIADGNGISGDIACGYGDAAMIADSESDTILVMCGTGNVSYWGSKRNNPLRVARLYSNDGGKTWTKPVDVTEQIYSLFDARGEGNEVPSLFCASGRILQSRMIKAGKHYRVYTALCTHKGNFVLYSDDLGKNWNVLGGPNSECAPKGDEPKCEELPNGDVVLSSRCHYGRMFNVYHYSNPVSANGKWENVVNSFDMTNGIKVGRNATNGEILLLDVKRKDNNTKTCLMLQSLPAADNRSEVTIFYKALNSKSDYSDVKAFASNWEGSFKVTEKTSAYSTMVLQKDLSVAFYLEEEEGNGGYDMNYLPLTVEQITGGKYCAIKQSKKKLK